MEGLQREHDKLKNLDRQNTKTHVTGGVVSKLRKITVASAHYI